MLKVIYNILVCFAAPLATCVAGWRGLRDPTRRERVADRFGHPDIEPASPNTSTIWLHAASMGEVQAGSTLVKRLLETYPQHRVVITTMTTTGAARVHALFGKRVTHCFLPYDVGFAVSSFLTRVQPSMALILETELWPNLLSACQARQIPVLVTSARISPRTAKRYQWLASLFRSALTNVSIYAQTPLDADRFRALGARKVSVGGNLKFDIEIGANMPLQGNALRAKFLQRPCWVAGSTHEGEEIAAVQAHQALLKSIPNAVLLLVPRHPQRFAAVEKLLQSQNIDHVTWRSGQSPASTHVWLIDTLGELMNCYAAADVAFVGGSLVAVGGHNLLEPAALGKPIVCGPYNSNAQDIFDLLTQNTALDCVQTADELGASLIKLMHSEAARKQLGLQGKQIVNSQGGALDRTMLWIHENDMQDAARVERTQ